MDVQWVIDLGKVIHYLKKYITKVAIKGKVSFSRQKSALVLSTKRTIARAAHDSNLTGASVLRRMLLKCNSARDIGHLETCHLNLMLPLYRSSEQFVRVYFNGTENDQDEVKITDQSINFEKSLVHLYAFKAEDTTHSAEWPKIQLLIFGR